MTDGKKKGGGSEKGLNGASLHKNERTTHAGFRLIKKLSALSRKEGKYYVEKKVGEFKVEGGAENWVCRLPGGKGPAGSHFFSVGLSEPRNLRKKTREGGGGGGFKGKDKAGVFNVVGKLSKNLTKPLTKLEN